MDCFYVAAILSYGWGWVEVDIEAEVESKFSWNWVQVELSWGWDKLTLNEGRNWVFVGVGLWFKICFRSTHVALNLSKGNKFWSKSQTLTWKPETTSEFSKFTKSIGTGNQYSCHETLDRKKLSHCSIISLPTQIINNTCLFKHNRIVDEVN